MSNKTSLPCPACREDGHDKKGNHLALYPGGAFHCIFGGKDKAHNRRILELWPDLGKDVACRPVASTRSSDLAKKKKRELGPVVAKYAYHDESGREIYQVHRHEPKDFSQHRIVDGEIRPTMEGIARVPYRLTEVQQATTIWIVEGEKDADNLSSIGIAATCNAGGAGKWDAAWSHYFAGKDIILCGDNDQRGREHMAQVDAALRPVVKSIRFVTITKPSKDISDYLAGLSDTEARVAVEELVRSPDPLDVLLDTRRFDLDSPPPRPVPVLLINGKAIATAGNLVANTGGVKSGKTAGETAMIAALMNPSGDCLGITGQNPDGLPVVHVDTEQSAFDHHAVVLQILKRAGLERPPDWFRSYRLADVSIKDRRKALAHEMKRAAMGGKLRAVFIDGVADLCVDPNDSAEAFGLVEELHRLAIIYDCPIVCVLHENPGSEHGKTRGHLGSQLERKAETNLRLVKGTDGVTMVFTERSRHCHIPKESGPRFAWDDAAGMHVSVESAFDEKQKHLDFTLQAVVDEAFDGRDSLRYSELISEVMRIKNVKDKTAEKTVSRLVPNYIRKHSHGYSKV